MEWFNEAEEKGGSFFRIVDVKNKGDGTALHQAVDDEATEAARRLLEIDADVNAVGGEDRWTPLHVAADAELIKTLLKAKADPRAGDKGGNTPVDQAKWRYGDRGVLWFREAGLTRLVEMEGGSRSDAQVLKPLVSPTAESPLSIPHISSH